MFIKAQRTVNGIAQDIFIDPNTDWIAIRFTDAERMHIANLGGNQVFIAAPIHLLKGNPAVIKKWATQWPNRYYGGSHKPPEGALLLPGNVVKVQDGNS